MRWYCYDGLGSVLGEVAPDGTLTRAQSYDVYGCVRTAAGTATSRHKFVGALGHPSEDETGLIYMRARYDDPVTGRFQSEDPARDGGNWFAYSASSPAVLVDQDGRRVLFSESNFWNFALLVGLFLQATGTLSELGDIGNRINAALRAKKLFEWAMQAVGWTERMVKWALGDPRERWRAEGYMCAGGLAAAICFTAAAYQVAILLGFED